MIAPPRAKNVIHGLDHTDLHMASLFRYRASAMGFEQDLSSTGSVQRKACITLHAFSADFRYAACTYGASTVEIFYKDH